MRNHARGKLSLPWHVRWNVDFIMVSAGDVRKRVGWWVGTALPNKTTQNLLGLCLTSIATHVLIHLFMLFAVYFSRVPSRMNKYSTPHRGLRTPSVDETATFQKQRLCNYRFLRVHVWTFNFRLEKLVTASKYTKNVFGIRRYSGTITIRCCIL